MDRMEIDRFKREIDLVEFATSRGYVVDARESSLSSKVLRLAANHDKVIVGRAADGHWHYFSVRDRHDNGSIIDFLQRRESKNLGQVRRELREWTRTSGNLEPSVSRPVVPVTKDRAAVVLEVARARVVDQHPYLAERGLRPEILRDERFRGTWKEAAGKHRNVLFPHYDSGGLSGFEAKNHQFTGFAKGGGKGLWVSNARAEDTRLVITESAIDAMSYHQLHPHRATRYASFGGQQSPRQPELLARAIARMPVGSTIVAATDNDVEGHAFATGIRELCGQHRHVTFERHCPTNAKDWNDVVQARQRSVSRSPSATLLLSRKGPDLGR